MASALSEPRRVGDPLLDERVLREQLQMSYRQIERVPRSLLVVDSFVAWLSWQAGHPRLAVAWFLLALAVQSARALYARRLARKPQGSAAQDESRLTVAFVAVGFVRSLVVPLVFSSGHPEGLYLLTMVTVGTAAGGISSVAGLVRPYAAWCTFAVGSLVIGWLLTASVEGFWVAVLLLLMCAILVGYVRDQAATTHRLVTLAHEKEELFNSLRVERDRAEAASQAKTRFFAAASHDLRQPLHALSINATTLDLVAKRSGDPVLKELSLGIGSALRQSRGLLDGLLDISRLDAQAVQIRLAPHEVVSLLHAIRDEYAALAAERGLAVRVETDGSPMWAATDPDQFLRILGNLVHNAIKFTTVGRVVLSARRVSGHVEVCVSDSGPGIPADERERVFEEFYQLGNPSRDRSQGLGLGLAIVQRTARLLGIGLKLGQAPGGGARFELLLPAAPVGQASHEAARAPEVPLSVLMVDDEPDVLASLATYLGHIGWPARGVASGAAADRALDDGFVPDVLVVDYRLRGENGLEVIERLRARLPGVPAVIVTGDVAPIRLEDSRALAADVLHKPVDGAHLVRALSAAVARS